MSVQDIFQQRKVLFLKENSKMSRTIVLKKNLQMLEKYSVEGRDKIFEARKQIRSDLWCVKMKSYGKILHCITCRKSRSTKTYPTRGSTSNHRSINVKVHNPLLRVKLFSTDCISRKWPLIIEKITKKITKEQQWCINVPSSRDHSKRLER